MFGFGYWGPVLLRVFNESAQFRVTHVVEPDARRHVTDLATVGASCRFLQGSDDLPWDEVDVVAVAVPPQHHGEIVRQALQRGKHIWCEKPLGVDFSEASEMRDQVKAVGAVLWVDMPYIFHPAVTYLGDLHARGEMGQLTYYVSNRSNFGLDHQSVDVSLDLMVHDLYLQQIFFRDPPSWVSATRHHLGEKGTWRLESATAGWPNGTVSHCLASQLSATKVRHVQVGGTVLTADFDDNRLTDKLTIVPTIRDSATLMSGDVVRSSPRLGEARQPLLSLVEPLAFQVEAFAQALLSGGPSTLNLACNAHLWLAAIRESAEQSGAPTAIERSLWSDPGRV